MNFDFGPVPTPLRILMVNSLSPSSQLIMMKVLGGEIFGPDQVIDMTMLVYENEVNLAQVLKIELISCAYSCTNSIEISTNLPRVSDADVFCFITNFSNPNWIDFDNIESGENFDTFYMLLKIAHNFSLHPPLEEPQNDKFASTKRKKKQPPKRIKPIFITDGLVALDIIYTVSKIIPADVIFCPSSIPSTAKAVLADYLKVNCDVINDILVWAVSDKIFHIDVEMPCIIHDSVEGPRCVWKMMGRQMLNKLNLDHTHFNSYWLKKDYIAKVAEITENNPYGTIFRGQMLIKTLQEIWMQRNCHEDKKPFTNLGIISDGSLGTIKACPFVLPLRFYGDNWEVDTRFDQTAYLKHEVNRMNAVIKVHHHKLMKYCNKFLERNVIQYAFVPSEESALTLNISTSSTSYTALFSESHENSKSGNTVEIK